MKIEVGEYIRTSRGLICKIIEFLERNKFLTDKGPLNLYDVIIVKHSKNIIDLIEVGDYVNGKLIHKIDNCYLYYGNCKTFVSYQIKSIVTKEKIEMCEYKVEE